MEKRIIYSAVAQNLLFLLLTALSKIQRKNQSEQEAWCLLFTYEMESAGLK